MSKLTSLPIQERNIKVGQVWENLDSRLQGRYVRILSIDKAYGEVKVICINDGKKYTLRDTSFNYRNNGYGLYADV